MHTKTWGEEVCLAATSSHCCSRCIIGSLLTRVLHLSTPLASPLPVLRLHRGPFVHLVHAHRGQVNSQLVQGSGHTAAALTQVLQNLCIFFIGIIVAHMAMEGPRLL